MAISFGLQRCRGYIEGSPVRVITDHRTLSTLQTQAHPGDRVRRFLDEIAHFSPTIEYRPGKANNAADALSRASHGDEPQDVDAAPLFSSFLGSVQDPASSSSTTSPSSEAAEGPETGAAAATTAEPSSDPQEDEARAVIRTAHQELGHYSTTGIIATVARQTCFKAADPRLRELVLNELAQCAVCQQTTGQHKGGEQSRALRGMDTFAPLTAWSFDFIGPLKRTALGNAYIATAMELATGYMVALATPDKSLISSTRLFRHVLALFGAPSIILTDNGREWCNDEFLYACKVCNIEHRRTSPYTPQTNASSRMQTDS